MFKDPIYRVLYRFISHHFLDRARIDVVVSKLDLFLLSCLISRIPINASKFLYAHLTQVALDKKNKKPCILCGGIIIAFVINMINFKVDATKLPVVLGKMFLT